MTWSREGRRLALARKARKGDSNYLHAQLLLAGQRVVKDEIVGNSHVYHFDCACVRTYTMNSDLTASESISACAKHGSLIPAKRR